MGRSSVTFRFWLFASSLASPLFSNTSDFWFSLAVAKRDKSCSFWSSVKEYPRLQFLPSFVLLLSSVSLPNVSSGGVFFSVLGLTALFEVDFNSCEFATTAASSFSSLSDLKTVRFEDNFSTRLPSVLLECS